MLKIQNIQIWFALLYTLVGWILYLNLKKQYVEELTWFKNVDDAEEDVAAFRRQRPELQVGEVREDETVEVKVPEVDVAELEAGDDASDPMSNLLRRPHIQIWKKEINVKIIN